MAFNPNKMPPPPGGCCRPDKKPPEKPPFMPGEALPIYPTYSTQVIHGKTYKTYLETDWHQVKTNDGVSLHDLLQSIPLFDAAKGFYKYCGIIRNNPTKISAMKQLNLMTDQAIGDVYLIETEVVVDGGYVCEAYVWLGNDIGWTYCGTTNRKKSLEQDLSETVRLLPEDLGEPGEVLLVGSDGKSLVWGAASSTAMAAANAVVQEHNDDGTSHQDIRDEMLLKADKLSVFMDTLEVGQWKYNETLLCYEYTYSSDNLPINAYFEITAIAETYEDTKMLSEAGIHQGFQIITGNNEPSYAIFRSKYVPADNIKICVKNFGTVIDETE